MKNTSKITRAMVAAAFLLAGFASLVAVPAARADDCGTVGGVIVNGTCQVSAPSPVLSGSLSFDETLLLLTGGVIRVASPAGVDIKINSGDLLMNNGATITGGAVATCSPEINGAPIRITVINGSVETSAGSTIQSNGCSGGEIFVTTTGAGRITIGGVVESVAARTGTGASQQPGGGPITIKAGCALTVNNNARVSSRGRDPGADLVHLEGCEVTILGRVESTGEGHAIPNTPKNHCGFAGKSPSSTACVQIWSGGSVLIDSTGDNKGEVGVDNGFRGGANGRSWIEIFAAGAITITDGPGNDHKVEIPGTSAGFQSLFAVHASMFGVNSGQGGLINITSTTAGVTASGNVAEASATTNGSNGGEIHIEANQGLTLAGANIFAQGDIIATGGYGEGGQIGTTSAPLRAFNGPLSWTTGIGDAQPTGSPLIGGESGVVNLRGCGSVTATATFPATKGTFSPTTTNVCGGAPTLPSYVALPSNCTLTCTPRNGSITGIKWNDLNGNGVQDPNEPGLATWQIHLFTPGSAAEIANTFTGSPDGTYTFSDLADGTYEVCESLTDGWKQTAPAAPKATGLDCAKHGGGFGYLVTITGGQAVSGIDFGNQFVVPANGVKMGKKWNDLNGDGVPDSGEPGLPGWVIRLFNASDLSLVREVTTTAPNGDYSFGSLAPGSYIACEVGQAGWKQTAPNSQTVPSPGEQVVDCSSALGINVPSSGYAFLINDGTEVFSPNDFGNQQIPPTGEISGTKWNDLNGNGARDPDEPGLPNWSIHLFQSGQIAQFAQVLTGADGTYSFSNLPAGDYDVCETLISGWRQTFPGVARTATLDCEARTGGRGYTVTITAGQAVSGVDFGNQLIPALANGIKNGTKWNDLNGDGVRDADEPGLPGWEIHLLKVEDPSFHQQVNTDANGAYSFTGLAPGIYLVCEAPQVGWTQTAPNRLQAPPPGERVADCTNDPGVGGLGYVFSIVEGNEIVSGNDFGNQQVIIVLPARISGTKWNDLNGNGARDLGEPGLQGWRITVFDTGSTLEHAHTFTDTDGNYAFLVPAGSYVICESPTAGWTQTFPASGINCQALTGGFGYSTTVTAGQLVTGIDFANHLTAATSGTKTGKKWSDLNANGLKDVGEPGLAGWQIHLFRSGDASFHQQVATDGNGDYSFTGLLPGTYTVCETMQAGSTQTAPNAQTTPPSGEQIADCTGRPGVGGFGYTFTISGNEVVSGNDFGNNRPLVGMAQIAGTKWNDANGSGRRNPGEPGLAGWPIHLFRNGDASFHQQVVTDANGSYRFTGLLPGTYTVCEGTRADGIQTAPNAQTPPPSGEQIADCSSHPGVGRFGYTVIINGAEIAQGNDFGNQEAAAIPTLSEWGMLTLALLLMGLGYARARRRPDALSF